MLQTRFKLTKILLAENRSGPRHSFQLQIRLQIIFNFVFDPLVILSLFYLLRIYDKIIRCLCVQKKKKKENMPTYNF